MTEFQILIRSYIFRGVAVFAFAILATQLWNLQVLQGVAYLKLSDANRFRLIQVPVPRGVIYDRNDKLLVRNRPVYNIIIIPAFLPDDATTTAKIFTRLSELLDLPITTQTEPTAGKNNGYFHAITHHQFNRQLQRQITNPRSRRFVNAPLGIRDAVEQTGSYAPFLAVTIAKDIDLITVAKIEEERLDLPGVQIDISPSRDYLYGQSTGHLLGYTGPIPAERFSNYEKLGYDVTDKVGVAGLENQYEEWLRGIKGLESIEVNVNGQRLRTVSQNVQTRPAHNLRLTIDIGLQEATRKALQAQLDESNSKQGVAIAMNPQTGEILAMVSLPDFDNNSFSRGITSRELSRLNNDSWNPLINHAISGLYPPGSTFKVIPAAGALQERVVTPTMTFLDTGVLYLPNKFEPDNLDLAQPFYCWLRTGHGEVNLLSGLVNSCDVYFYNIGGGYEPDGYEGLGLERLGKYMEMFGLGQPSGIDLPGEAAGLVPTQKWKRLNYAEVWVTGDTYNLSIGQGFVLATPLQVLNFTAAIANDGILYKPYLVSEILDADGNVVKRIEPEIIRRLDVEPQFIRLIQQGLRGVISWETGTARKEFDVPGIIASGKTGTAEFCDQYPQCIDRNGRVTTSHAWFTAYAPSNSPEIVTVVFVYGGGEGSKVAVPVTNKMLRYYFNVDGAKETVTIETVPEPVVIVPEADSGFTARLIGTDSWDRVAGTASVSGFLLDEQGRGITDVTVDILTNSKLTAQITTGLNGQFAYEISGIIKTDSWLLRLPDYQAASTLQLEVAKGLHYLVEFKLKAGELNAQ